MKQVIIIKAVAGDELRTRRVAALILPYMSEDVVLDFSGVNFMSRSFADELYNIKCKFKHVDFSNMQEQPACMYNVVCESRSRPRVRPETSDAGVIKDLKTMQDLDDYTLGMCF